MGTGSSKTQKVFAPTGDSRDQLANRPIQVDEENITGSDFYIESPIDPGKSTSPEKNADKQTNANEKYSDVSSNASVGARFKSVQRKKVSFYNVDESVWKADRGKHKDHPKMMDDKIKENSPFQSEEQDDGNSVQADQPTEGTLLLKPAMSNSSSRPVDQASFRFDQPSMTMKQETSKSLSGKSRGKHSANSNGSNDSRNREFPSSSRKSSKRRQSKSSEHKETCPSRNSYNKHSPKTDKITRSRNTESLASSRESKEDSRHKSVKNTDTSNPGVPTDSTWRLEKDSPSQATRNKTPSEIKTPKTDGKHEQSDHRGSEIKSNTSSLSTAKSQRYKPPGTGAKEEFSSYSPNVPVAPIEFRAEKPKASKALRSNHDDQPKMVNAKIKQLPNDPKLNENLEFYKNRIRSRPGPGHTIEEMLQWRGNYRQLEINHRYIQWLFPIPDSSDYNLEAQPLQAHEALALRGNRKCRSSFLKAYEMMLDFYGMMIVSMATGEVNRCDKNWKKRFAHLNKSGHNYLRITRILKALAYFGLAKFQKPWIMFFLNEVFVTKALSEIRHGAVIHWIDNMDDLEESAECFRWFQDLHANIKRFPQSPIQTPVEESDSESEDNEGIESKPREYLVVDNQPPPAEGNTAELMQASFNQSAREKRREKQIQNVKFYKNDLRSKPDPGSNITEMLNWKGNHNHLEKDRYYIQWLFPIPETTGVNADAQPLLPHEITIIREDKCIQKRFLKSYDMMLDLYGMKLISQKSGTVSHARTRESRYEFLSSSLTDHKRITRIINALECFGFQHFQFPLVSFLINEIFATERLVIPLESVGVWVGIMADDEDKVACAEAMGELLVTAPVWNDREI